MKNKPNIVRRRLLICLLGVLALSPFTLFFNKFKNLAKRAYLLFCIETAEAGPAIPPLPENIATLPGSQLTAIWANEGGDKVTRDELRATRGMKTQNSIWTGSEIRQFGARNEVVSVNLILEAAKSTARNVSVSIGELIGPGAAKIESRKADKGDLFDYTGRNIELFYVRYLQIRGLSRMGYDPTYDDRHVPFRLRFPRGDSKGVFTDRPDANKYYPDIAVPIEAIDTFAIQKGENQGIWIDIYIPKNTPPGKYVGKITVHESNKDTLAIPISLNVLPFSLPDVPSAKTMVYFSETNVYYRYTGVQDLDVPEATPDKLALMHKAWNNHHLVAHRHKISLISDGNEFRPWDRDNWSRQRWDDILKGNFFIKQNGYDGPGVGISSGVFSIGTYGGWSNSIHWAKDNQEQMNTNTDFVASLFKSQYPEVEPILYLKDEPNSSDYAQIEQWAGWVKRNPGPGQNLKTFITLGLVKQQKYIPSVDIAIDSWGDTAVWQPLMAALTQEGKEYWSYNGGRPSTGSFMTEDDGVALRMLGWTQFKHKIARWFYWESTQYLNQEGGHIQTNVFEDAQTFGPKSKSPDPKYGETSYNYMNGDGILFYPGTETLYPKDSYGLSGPIASLRLKLWRRGIQDNDYLTLAAQKDPKAVSDIVQKMIPKTLWEIGVTDHNDPTYVLGDISWSINPDDWENARWKLANIIQEIK